MIKDFLSFNKMISSTIVTVIYYINVAGAILWGIGFIIAGATGNGYGAGGKIFTGIMLIILGPLFVRIFCEMLIVVFKINDTLTDIKNNLRQV